MNTYQTWARGSALAMLIGMLISTSEHAAGQSYQLKVDNVSALSGVWTAGGFTMLAVAGQPSPLKASSNSNNILIPGFMATITSFEPCTGSVVAEVDAPLAQTEGSQIQALLSIDMSGVPAPDSLLGSFTGSLSWDPALLSYVSHSAYQSGFIGVVNTTDVANGFLEFNGANPIGADANVPIIGVLFDVVGAAGDTGRIDLNYSDMVAAGTFQNLTTCLTVKDAPFEIEAASSCLVCGDVNSDSTAGSSDALIILSYDVGIPLPPELLEKITSGCGDVNADSLTGSSDALIILSYDAGLPVPFPVGSPGGCDAPRSSAREHDVIAVEEKMDGILARKNSTDDSSARPTIPEPKAVKATNKFRKQD